MHLHRSVTASWSGAHSSAAWKVCLGVICSVNTLYWLTQGCTLLRHSKRVEICAQKHTDTQRAKKHHLCFGFGAGANDGNSFSPSTWTPVGILMWIKKVLGEKSSRSDLWHLNCQELDSTDCCFDWTVNFSYLSSSFTVSSDMKSNWICVSGFCYHWRFDSFEYQCNKSTQWQEF